MPQVGNNRRYQVGNAALQCFTNGQEIMSKYMGDKWIGRLKFSRGERSITHSSGVYKSLNQFHNAHVRYINPHIINDQNAWDYCECKVPSGWVPVQEERRYVITRVTY